MLQEYDVDGTGTVEEEEFASFLLSMQETAKRSQEWLNCERYVMAQRGDTKYPDAYVPPDSGAVDCSFQFENSGSFFQAVSADSILINAIIHASRAVPSQYYLEKEVRLS